MASLRRFSRHCIFLQILLYACSNAPVKAAGAQYKIDALQQFQTRNSPVNPHVKNEHRERSLLQAHLQVDKESTNSGIDGESSIVKVAGVNASAVKRDGLQPDEGKGAIQTPKEAVMEEQLPTESTDNATPTEEDERTLRISRAREKTKPFAVSNPNPLGPPIKDWDEQRAAWLAANPQFKTPLNGKPPVLIVSGSPPKPCITAEGDDFHIRSLKLKVDYARMHNYELYYSFAWLEPSMGGVWVKHPLVRKLMLTHPEIEWFFWVDADAVFTDMLFEPPLETYPDHNMLIWGWSMGLHEVRSWTAINAGVFLVRNCQSSLDLLDKWSSHGDEETRHGYGKLINTYFSDRSDDMNAGDQPPLGYLILTDETVRSKVKMIEADSYLISAWWLPTVGTYENSMEKYHPGLGDVRWPWITHFTGCSPCGGDNNADDSTYDQCMNNFARAYHFADNQVLAYMGFEHESLSSSRVSRTRNETDRPLDFVGTNPWEARMARVASAEAGKSGPGLHT